MCRQINCSTCKKPTWAGCGAHIEQVLGAVPKADRCQCTAADRQAAKAAGGKLSGGKAGWFQRLLGAGKP